MPYETMASRASLRGLDDAPEIEAAPASGVFSSLRRRCERVRAGDLIENRYRVLSAAATGGMGSVYICDDTLLGRRVAVKCVRTDANADGNLAERFFAEARITAQLESPHIARLYDYGIASSGDPYMVVEFVDGPDLFTVLHTEGPRSSDEVVSYMLQICEGLREAHRKGIVHCDLKPENLVLARTPDGAPVIKIVDFGIAKWRADPQVAALTRTSILEGSPNYMSPEQIETPAGVDVRTDIWSLGVTMFELLTGRVPFCGSDDQQTCVHVLNGPLPPVTSALSDVPPELEATIRLCLARDRNDRFSDVDHLTLALSAVVLRKFERLEQVATADTLPGTTGKLCTVEQPSPARTTKRWGRRHLWALAVVVTLLGVRSDAEREAAADEGAVAALHG